jgi:hypothetical protein
MALLYFALRESSVLEPILRSRELGTSADLLALAHDIGLDKTIAARTNQRWVRDVLAICVGRIVRQGSKTRSRSGGREQCALGVP